jgi:hypothetical protein
MVRAFSFEVLFLNIFSKNGMSPSVAKAIFLSNSNNKISELLFSSSG